MKYFIIILLLIGCGKEYNNNSDLSRVIGSDDRRQIFNTTIEPYKYIGLLKFKRNGSNYTCTGTLVGRKHVLTAGHCVYNSDEGAWAKDVYFIPGKNGRNEPYGRYRYAKVATNKEYYETGNKKYDYGLVVLKDEIGSEIGFMEMKVLTDDSINFNLAGYSGDKPYGTLWKSFCKMIKQTDKLVLHECDAYSGSSGSAMYKYYGNNRTIYAIHAGTYGNVNRGTKIDQSMYETLNKWINEYYK